MDLKYFTTDKAFYRDKDIRDAWISGEDSDFPLIRFHSLDAMDWLDGWATCRRGGVSQGCFSSLNLGFNTGDDPVLVRENIRRLGERLGIADRTMVRSHQVHGTRLLNLKGGIYPASRVGQPTGENVDSVTGQTRGTSSPVSPRAGQTGDQREPGHDRAGQTSNHKGPDPGQAGQTSKQREPSHDQEGPDLTPYEDLIQVYSGYDGFYTDQPGLTLAVSVADCVPILLADPVSRQVAAVHSGWKGTVGKIGAKAVDAMAAGGARPDQMTAVIGPSISGSHYEVTGELIREFARVFSPEEMKTITVQTDEIHYLLDLWAACWYYLRQAGLKEENIHFSGLCTFENWQELFSHRRSGGKRGIMNCLIRIRQD